MRRLPAAFQRGGLHGFPAPGGSHCMGVSPLLCVAECMMFSSQTDKGRNPIISNRVPEGPCKGGVGWSGGQQRALLPQWTERQACNLSSRACQWQKQSSALLVLPPRAPKAVGESSRRLSASVGLQRAVCMCVSGPQVWGWGMC